MPLSAPLPGALSPPFTRFRVTLSLEMIRCLALGEPHSLQTALPRQSPKAAVCDL